MEFFFFLLTGVVGVPTIIFMEYLSPRQVRARVQRMRNRKSLPGGAQSRNDLQMKDWLEGTAVFEPSRVTFEHLEAIVERHLDVTWDKCLPYNPTKLAVQGAEAFLALKAHTRLEEIIQDEARRTSAPSAEFIEHVRTALNKISNKGYYFVHNWIAATNGSWTRRTPEQVTGEQQQQALLEATREELIEFVTWKYSKDRSQIKKALTRGQVPL